MAEAFGIAAVINFFFLFAVSAADMVNMDAAGITDIFCPFLEDGSLMYGCFAANLAFCFLIQLLFLKREEQQWAMLSFLVRSKGRKRLFLSQKKDLYGYLLAVFIGKLLSDGIYFGIFVRQKDFCGFVYTEASFLLITAVWMEIIYLMFALRVKGTYGLFMVLALSAVSLILIPYTGFSFFAYGSLAFSWTDLFIKALVWAVLFAAGAAAVMKMDLLGHEQ